MKKQGNCDQCKERHELDNEFESTFHKHFKYRKFPVMISGYFFNPFNHGMNMFLCKDCKREAMRAMKNGDNWE